jgi:hypothetical protein
MTFTLYAIPTNSTNQFFEVFACDNSTFFSNKDETLVQLIPCTLATSERFSPMLSENSLELWIDAVRDTQKAEINYLKTLPCLIEELEEVLDVDEKEELFQKFIAKHQSSVKSLNDFSNT